MLKLNLRRNKDKKGSIFDAAITIPIYAFLIGMMIVIAYFVMSSIMEVAEDDQTFIDNNDSLIFMTDVQEQMTIFDAGYIILILAMVVGAIAASFSIKTYPVFSIVAIILILISSIMMAYFSNAFEDVFVGSSSAFDATTTTFASIKYIMAYLPFILVVTSVAVAIITFSKGD